MSKAAPPAAAAESTACYLIGIDLGTTHTVVSYAELNTRLRAADRKVFEIEQLVAPGEVAARPLLPCFRYHPLPGELAEADCLLPWGKALQPLIAGLPQALIGEWARDLGARVDGRQVVSAKSWLSNPQVDRRAEILPWAAAEGVEKISPLDASASYLAYVRAAWDHAHPDAPLEHQDIVITVPASFDEVARVMTVEAARLAGLPQIHLLEEPQAVCYDWFACSGGAAAERVGDARLLLVCDVGGGTTDLSLIQIDTDQGGELQLSRVAVGDHLMLGGDNIDLALAHLAESRLKLGKKLSAAQLSQLIQQTRSAKERLLAMAPVEAATVTLLGSGSRLIGGAKSCQLTQQDIEQIALDGFLPLTAVDELPTRKRSAVVEFGLPYASDPAISRHLAGFLQAHQAVARKALGLAEGGTALPDGLMLNGGVFKSPQLAARVTTLLERWRGDRPCNLLENQHPDLAVAYGAVAYAMARRGGQRKIGGGSARSYFLVLEQDGERQPKGICLLPRGSEEGREVRLSGRQFLLTLDQPVRFSVCSSSQDRSFAAGELTELDESFSQLPPLIAALGAEDLRGGSEARVELLACLTEVGTLQLECLSLDLSGQRWKVEFQVRRQAAANLDSGDRSLPARWPEARQKLELIFGSSKRKVDPKKVKSLRNDLEKCLGKRDAWDINLLRAMFDLLLEGMAQRKRSQTHERVWLNLAGFCLRPGFGDPADEWRMKQVWSLFAEGLHYDREIQSWIDWWTFWRRLAGGLGVDQQSAIFAVLKPLVDPASNHSRKLQAQAKLMSYEDMVRLTGALEKLPVETKILIGEWLLQRLEKTSETITSWWSLGRIGSRVPFHGSAHNVVPKKTVEEWLEILLLKDWNKNIAFAAVMLGRLSGDRSRDIDSHLQQRIIERLQHIKAPDTWVAMISEVYQVDEQDARRIFGESLPGGLKLLD